MQHTKVQRHGQQGVRHRPVLTHDRVFVAAEEGKAVVDESRQRAFGFRRCDCEQSRPVDADGVQVHAVEVDADVLVDVVLAGLVRVRSAEGVLLLRWGLAVLLVEVPAASHGVRSVHQDVEAAALVAVEILHPKACPVSGPFGELCAGESERRCGQNVGDQILFLEPLDEPFGGV